MGHRLVKTPAAAIALVLGFAALGGMMALGVPSTSHAIAAPGSAGPARDAPLLRAAAPVAALHAGPAVTPPTLALALQAVSPPAYLEFGYSFNFTITTGGYSLTPSLPATAANTLISLTIEAEVGTTAPFIPAYFTEWGVPVSSGGQTHFSTPITMANAATNLSAWAHGTWPSNMPFYVQIAVISYPNATLAAPAGPELFANASTATLTEAIVTPPWATLLTPSISTGGPQASPGNVTVVIQYSGDDVTAANITIVNSGGTLVFSTIMTSLDIGNVTSAAATPWLVVTPGSYTATIDLTTAYGTVASFPFTFDIVKSSGATTTIWVNSTLFHNGSTNKPLISGLSNGATASILLVVGLIIGLVVALVLGRMMWGGSPPSTPPAQPWSASKSTNECPVCHQSFASEDEMKEHQKTAHGM